MNYIKSTIKYLLKNKWRMLLTILPVAIFASFLFEPTPSAINVFIYQYEAYSGNFTNILSAFGINFDGIGVILHIAFILVATVFLSYSYIAIYRHFRTGKLSIRSPLPYINSGFVPLLVVILTLYLLFIVFNFLLGCVIALVDVVISHFLLPKEIFIVIVYAFLLGQLCFYSLMLTIPLKVLPGMCVYGYSFIEAWNSTNRVLEMLDKNKKSKIFFAVLFPFFLFVVIGIVDAFTFNFLVTRVILFTLIISYYAVLSHILMFELSQFERRDLAPYKEI